MLHVIDTYAWIEYFRGTEEGMKAKGFIENRRSVTPTIVIAELAFKFEKQGEDFSKNFEFLRSTSKILPLDEGIALKAGKINLLRRAKIKDWGIADTLVLASAEQTGATIVTGDPHFKDLKNVVMIK